jgi:hypothetical protein
VEQHGDELNDDDGEEEKDEDDTNGLQMQILFGDYHLYTTTIKLVRALANRILVPTDELSVAEKSRLLFSLQQIKYTC